MNHPTLESADNYVPRGLLLQWHITNRCNLRCAHCYQETYKGAESELSDLIEVLRQYEELLGGWRESRPETQIKGHITVTGGEPFVRGDFVELLHEFALRRHSFSFGILLMRCHPPVKRHAAMAGRAAFFAPLTFTVPFSASPP